MSKLERLQQDVVTAEAAYEEAYVHAHANTKEVIDADNAWYKTRTALRDYLKELANA
tara:strand:- start:291 stop:461 length:171 start_codon:yes stop_codon:yes gene_type:complete